MDAPDRCSSLNKSSCAAGIYEDALAVREASLGSDHQHSRILREYIADFSTDTPTESHEASVIAQIEDQISFGYSISRDIPREEAFREASNIGQCDLGGSHPATGRACAALAEILDFRGCPQEARKYWFHHCDIAMLRHGADSVEVEQAFSAIVANQQNIAQGGDRGRSEVQTLMAMRADEHLHAWLLGRLAEVA